jgi:GTPase SAR1 family protein
VHQCLGHPCRFIASPPSVPAEGDELRCTPFVRDRGLLDVPPSGYAIYQSSRESSTLITPTNEPVGFSRSAGSPTPHDPPLDDPFSARPHLREVCDDLAAGCKAFLMTDSNQKRTGEVLESVRRIFVYGRGGWVSWSRDGQFLTFGEKGGITLVEPESDRSRSVLSDLSTVTYAEWSHDNQFLAALVGSTQVIVFDCQTGAVVASVRCEGRLLAWHPRFPRLAIATAAGVSIISPEHWTAPRTIAPIDGPNAVAWMTDGSLLVGTSGGLQQFGRTSALTITAEGDVQVIAATDRFVAAGGATWLIAFDTQSGKETYLEAHTHPVSALTFSPDGQLLVSRATDGETVIWSTRGWRLLYSFHGGLWPDSFHSVAFCPRGNLLAMSTGYGEAVDLLRIHAEEAKTDSVLYMTSKIALVGDSGVGKTGLAWRLVHGQFEPQSSTHGEQFWVVDNLSTVLADGTECNAVLWDLAGQPDYRLIHSLFISDADVALLVFDPTNREDPLKGVNFWLRALSTGTSTACRTILVPARTDRGTGLLTAAELEQFCLRQGISGGFVATSAVTGEGTSALLERITSQINWTSRPATVTTKNFKRIKDHVLTLKGESNRQHILVAPTELRDEVSEAAGTEFTVADVRVATRHLANHGYVRQLRSSTGEEFVLLTPDLLNNLASSIVLEARRELKGLGALEEHRLASGHYPFRELEGLPEKERKMLLDAAVTLFIEHNVCFRASLGTETYIIFPSLINQNRPLIEQKETIDGNAYTISGATDNVYAALVVLLGYTNTFTRTNQWRNNAEYEMGDGQICGFRLAEEREGEIDLVLYFGIATAERTRQLFQSLFELFLDLRHVSVHTYPPVVCVTCKYAQPRVEVMKRHALEKRSMFCSNCGTVIPLASPILIPPAGDATIDRDQRTAHNRTQFEAALTRLKGLIRDRRSTAPPSCFISYARGTVEEDRWIEELAMNLRQADAPVLLDRWHNIPGASITRFLELAATVDFVIVVGTERLRAKYDDADATHVIASELQTVGARMRSRAAGSSVIPVLRSGTPETALPPFLQDTVFLDFSDDASYFEILFDLLLRLYDIGYDDPAVRDLRKKVSAFEIPTVATVDALVNPAGAG